MDRALDPVASWVGLSCCPWTAQRRIPEPVLDDQAALPAKLLPLHGLQAPIPTEERC